MNAYSIGSRPQGQATEITRSIRQAIASALRRTYRHYAEREVPDAIRVVMGELRRHIDAPDVPSAVSCGRG